MATNRGGRRPVRGPLDGPIPDDAWEVPEYLSERAKAEYERLAGILIDCGRAPATDPRLVESYAITYDLMRDCYAKLKEDGPTVTSFHGSIVKHPLLEAINAAQTRLKTIIEALNLTPRSKRGDISGPSRKGDGEVSGTGDDWGGILKFGEG